MIKATFWDFNGVVIADTWANYESDVVSIAHFGGRHHTLDEHRRTACIPASSFYISHGVDPEDLKLRGAELGEVFHRTYEALATRCRTRVGVRRTLEFLQSRSIPAVIFSNHTESGIMAQLRRLKLEQMFTKVYANTEKSSSIVSKNKRVWVSEHFRQTGHKPGEVLIIGDSPEETAIGKELGLVTVALTMGEYDTARLRKAKPDHLIHRVSQMIDIIKQHR
jgi:phosphoglycolate phosphatase-like HAD superfamily hydrolase